MHVGFCCICFSFSVLSQEIGWEDRLRNDLFSVGWDVNTLTQSIDRGGLAMANLGDGGAILCSARLQ